MAATLKGTKKIHTVPQFQFSVCSRRIKSKGSRIYAFKLVIATDVALVGGGWFTNMWYINSMENYSSLQKEEIQTQATM